MNGDLQNIDAEGLRQHYRTMWRIRALEQMALKGFDEKLVLGAIHPSIGQEAVAAGVIACLDRDDLLLSTHRGHGHTLAKGASSTAMMRELLGREGGNCGGKGGSMHIADFAIGMLGANGVVAANIVIAAGAAHAIKLKGESRLVVCFFGDGAINRGPFLEGLNWAAVFKLPVLFVCEDNGYAATTRTATMTAGGGPSVRARALGVAQAAFDDALRYAQDRHSFGKPIWKHQSIGNYLADGATKITAARQLILHAAERFDAGLRCDMEAGMAKLFASEIAMQVALDAVRVHGGYGYSTEYDVERYFRDAPLMIVGEGTNEIQRNVIAAQLVKRGGLDRG